MEFGRIVFRKNGNWQIFFGKNHGKLAHLKNLAPKIIYGVFLWYIHSDQCAYQCHYNIGMHSSIYKFI
jgi:hypothetical protein